MRTVLLGFVPVFLALGQLANGAPACGGHGDRNTLLVTTSWLADHLKDPNLVILGVGQDGDYEKGHIPGSLFVKYMDTHLMKSPAGLTVELPPMSELADTFGKLGVTNDSHVILYMTNDWVSPTTRVFITLDAMGLGDHTSILDGGLPAWKKEGRPVTTDVPSAKRGKLEPCAQNDVIVDLNYMKSNLHHPGVDIIDARMEAHHSGAEVPKNSRAGHIPSATSLPFEKLVDDNNKLKPAAELKAILSAAGVKPGDRVVSYCYIGQRATVIYFVARYLGYDARLYDGSWEEWNKHTELPTEVSATK
jgi:thiosulfate/3-mercaptopyruvate sulfurtransferase